MTSVVHSTGVGPVYPDSELGGLPRALSSPCSPESEESEDGSLVLLWSPGRWPRVRSESPPMGRGTDGPAQVATPWSTALCSSRAGVEVPLAVPPVRPAPGGAPALTVILIFSPRLARLRGNQRRYLAHLRPNLRNMNQQAPPTAPAASTAPMVVPANHPAARDITSASDIPMNMTRNNNTKAKAGQK